MKKNRKITLDEWVFRRQGLNIGRFRKKQIRHLSNKDIAYWLWYWESLKPDGAAAKLFILDYQKMLRERSIRKLTRSYTINVETYLKYPRNLGGKAKCRCI